MEKDKSIYRADVDYHSINSWYGNVMIDWESSDYLIPAELQMMFKFENEEQIYVVIHSCHAKCTEHPMLSNIWIKEYQGDTLACVRDLKPHAENNCCNGRTPLLRVIPCEAIHSQCLLMPLTKSSQQVIQIKCTSTWADKFYPIN